MKKLAVFLASMMMILSLSTPSMAGTPFVNARLLGQHLRIHRGLMSGQLSPVETNWLRGEQRATRSYEIIAKSDGRVTMSERAHLAYMQRVNSRDIYRMRHN
jgi:hypothetical protein